MATDKGKYDYELGLRPATYDDVHTVLSWRNEPATIRNMKTKRPLAFEEHEPWFKKTISDPTCQFLIIEADGEPIGQLRYNLEDDKAKVSTNITEAWHGRGVASRAFVAGSKHVKKTGFADVIFARVLQSNIGSIRAMQKAGYTIDDDMEYEGEPHYYMSHDLSQVEV